MLFVVKSYTKKVFYFILYIFIVFYTFIFINFYTIILVQNATTAIIIFLITIVYVKEQFYVLDVKKVNKYYLLPIEIIKHFLILTTFYYSNNNNNNKINKSME